MSPGTSTSQVSSGSRTTRQVQTQALRLGPVPVEGSGPVVEPEPGPGGDTHHVGAVVAAIGDEGDAGEARQLGHLVGEGQVGVHDEHLRRSGAAEPLDTGLHRPVEPASGLGEHHGAVAPGPARHLGVVAHHRHRQRVRRRRGRVPP